MRPDERRMLTLLEMAAQLGIHPNTLRRMNRAGTVPSYRVTGGSGGGPGRLRFDPEEVRAAIRARNEMR